MITYNLSGQAEARQGKTDRCRQRQARARAGAGQGKNDQGFTKLWAGRSRDCLQP